MAEIFNTHLVAQNRWPGHTISGTGNIAVILGCSYKVRLVQTPLEAKVIASQRCGDRCSHIIAPDGNWHEIQELHVPVAYVPKNFRNIGLLERD